MTIYSIQTPNAMEESKQNGFLFDPQSSFTVRAYFQCISVLDHTVLIK